MNKWKKTVSVVLIFTLLILESSLQVKAAALQYRKNVSVWVNGVEVGTVSAVDEDYENNLYLSVRGMAHALKDTEKAFTPVVEKKKIELTSGSSCQENYIPWSEKELTFTESITLKRNELWLNEAEKKYYSFIMKMADGTYDAFLTPVTLGMLFDIDIFVCDGEIDIDTSRPFRVSADDLETSGYLQGVNAVVIGDGTTGDIYFDCDSDGVLAIASVTKLMTYFVAMDAISTGECSPEDVVTISPAVSKLSNGSDGVLPMRVGTKITMSELFYGMLLPSSNECAMAVAEHVAGTEEAFVERMNAKAKELGLSEAEFYNSHGLPVFKDQLLPAKLQNHMTAEELFRMTSALMECYPQVTEITSLRTAVLPSLDREVKNSNALLYNMDSVKGLKTGTTNKAGACLVTCIPTQKEGQIHNLIVVLLGAEGELDRATVSELAARFAVTALADWRKQVEIWGEEDDSIPTDPNKVVDKLIRLAIRNKNESDSY